MPPGYSRENTTIKIYYYVSLWGNDIKAVLLGPGPDFQELVSKVGKSRQLAGFPDTNKYPGYKVVNIDGIDEIFEHRWKGDVVYVTDRPASLEQEKIAILRSELSMREEKLPYITETGDRFFELESMAELSFAALEYEKASMYAKQLIEMAAKCPDYCLSESAAKKAKEILKLVENMNMPPNT